jgi:hypothetical protein
LSPSGLPLFCSGGVGMGWGCGCWGGAGRYRQRISALDLHGRSPYTYGYIILLKESRPETEPEKKARLALERARATESNKLLKANSKMAEAVLAKVGGILLALGAILEKEQMCMVAPLIRDPLSTHMAAFQLMKTNAESVILMGGEGELDIDDIKDVIKQIAEAKKAIALATQMLATLSRAPGA